jgi:Fe-S cluster biogenesis protein NfuA
MWKDDVKEVLEKIRPGLQADGGDVELVSVEDDGTVKVSLQGHCRGCVYSQMTLKNGIEQVLKENVPEVKEVINV